MLMNSILFSHVCLTLSISVSNPCRRAIHLLFNYFIEMSLVLVLLLPVIDCVLIVLRQERFLHLFLLHLSIHLLHVGIFFWNCIHSFSLLLQSLCLLLPLFRCKNVIVFISAYKLKLLKVLCLYCFEFLPICFLYCLIGCRSRFR